MTLIALLLSQREVIQKHKTGIVLLLSAFGFISYMAVGALLFLLVEGPEFEKSQRDILDAKNRILIKYQNMSVDALDEFMEEMRKAGVRGLPRNGGTIMKWSFADSFFFVVTVLTTVGYGHFAPRTILGKLICIVFTAVGIPLTLIHLARYVDRFLKASENYKALLFRKYEDKFRPFYIRLMHAASLMSTIVLVCFIIPASIFVRFERGWSLFDGIYFCFISLTTVGLGDMVPALDPNTANAELYKFGASLYLIIGVTIIMFMMSMCGDFHRNYMNGYEKLPFIISTEKIPINPGNVHSYGSILTHSDKSESSGRN